MAQAARRRLELLGLELARAGVGPPPVESEQPGAAGDTSVLTDFPTAQVVPERGRHARSRSRPWISGSAGWLQDRLPAPLQGRVAVGSAHVAVIAVLAATALAITSYAVLKGRSDTQLVPAAQPAQSLVPTATPAEEPTAGNPSAVRGQAAVGGQVVVDVAGKVRRPGVATLPAGSRVIDAIHKAGGVRRGVNLSSLNLARVLVDGEQILVGVPTVSGVSPSAASGSGSTSGTNGALVNINTAMLDQLESLPGVGPVTAQKILDWRSAHGAFSAVDDLLEVDGIGPKTLADIAPHATL